MFIMTQKRIFTEDEIALISDVQIPVYKICKMVNASEPTVTKMRKALGIVTIRGAREGGDRGGKIQCICQNPECKKEINTIRSKFRKFCCHSCQQKTANVAAKGAGSRKMRNPNMPEYKKYAGAVHRATRDIYKKHIDVINPNGYPRTLCGVSGGWQLDHITPIKECFEQGISVDEAAAVTNLRMLPWKDNLMRQYTK
jgi:hypothetical protein